MTKTDNNKQQTVLKQQDAPVEVLIVDPITLPIAQVLARFQIHPLVVTAFAFITRITAAYLLMLNMTMYGAIFACIGFLLDGVDGKIARIRHVDEELHGTVDFLLDQVAFAVMAIGVTSTWNRLLAQNHMGYKKGVGEQVFTDALQSDKNKMISIIIKYLYKYFIYMRRGVARFRMTPLPTSIESEVVMFMIAPIFHYQIVILFLGILLLIPDILITLILILIKVLHNR